MLPKNSLGRQMFRKLKVVRGEGIVIVRHAHTELLQRIWQLRESVTAYDAAYVALAEALDAPVEMVE